LSSDVTNALATVRELRERILALPTSSIGTSLALSHFAQSVVTRAHIYPFMLISDCPSVPAPVVVPIGEVKVGAGGVL
jgi:hypothetical protein